MKISDNMVKALGILDLETHLITNGNIAAHAYNVTQGGELEGINLGWKGQEASTTFLCSIVSSVDEVWEEISAKVTEGGFDCVGQGWETERDNGRDHEMADGAVPIYSRDLFMAAIELNITSIQDTSDPSSYDEVYSFDDIARATLYDLAESIIDGLMSALITNAENTEVTA